MSGKEIITLQFGKASNFVGAHYFNIQEAGFGGFSHSENFIPEIQPDRLFRSSEFENTCTYKPRVILLDNVANVDKVPILNNVEETTKEFPEDTNLVYNKFTVHRQEETDEQLNKFLVDKKKKVSAIAKPSETFKFIKSHYDLKNVTKWEEYTCVDYHPRSTINLYGDQDMSTTNSTYFDGFSIGNNISFIEEYEERLRFFAEECDTLQGYQIIADGFNGYAGLSMSVLEYVKSEYPKKSYFYSPVYTTGYTDTKVATVNSVMCIKEANELCDIIAPLSIYTDPWSKPLYFRNVKNVKYQASIYDTSGFIATALDLITYPYRMHTANGINMAQYCCNITNGGRSLVLTGLAMPFPQLINTKQEFPFLESITPLGIIGISVEMESCYLLYKSAGPMFSTFDDIPGTGANIAQLIKKFQYNYSTKKLDIFHVNSNFRCPCTFPNLFNNSYNVSNPQRDEYGRLSEFYGMGTMINSKEIQYILDTLYQHGLKIKIDSILADENFRSDYKECLEKISDFSSYYKSKSF